MVEYAIFDFLFILCILNLACLGENLCSNSCLPVSASTVTFCQSWSTLVSLESAFNAEQEYDIIFAVTCTTKEIKNTNEVHD